MNHHNSAEPMLRFALKESFQPESITRLGTLFLKGRPSLPTPNYVVPLSRGIVPHMTPDNVSTRTSIAVAYAALEDFIEKSPSKAPIFKQPVEADESKLRRFTALPDTCLSILGPRRIPGLECPNQNTNSSIAISTSVGFQSLDVGEYAEVARSLQSDVVVAVVDTPSQEKVSQKRKEKSADRTHAWLRDMLKRAERSEISEQPIFASIPPLEPERQSFYLADLVGDYLPQISGLCLYDLDSMVALPKSIDHLPRLCLVNPAGPHDVLRAIQLGADLIMIPFVTAVSEAGLALDFSFSRPASSSESPIAIDLWSTHYSTSLQPFVSGCTCYTCTHHHVAYVSHLLNAREMLAWSLLQIHNFHVIESFFQDIRQTIVEGTFEQCVEKFNVAYTKNIPEATGEGPRVRGYQMKSVGGGEPKKNRKAYGRLDDQIDKMAEMEEEGIARPGENIDAGDMEEMGLGEKQS